MGNCASTWSRKAGSNSLDDFLFRPEIRRWIADCIREAESKEDPRVVVIGERGVGKSTLINSLRRLRPGAPGAASVGADEVVAEVPVGEGACYRDAGLVYQDVPGCRGNRVNVAMGEDYVKRFKLNKADACLFVYVSVLNSDVFACARALLEAGVAVYFVRNKVDVDCANEVEDGNAGTQEEALDIMRERAYAQMSAMGFQDLADPDHLFLISAKYANAVAEPRFDFWRLKLALAGSIRDAAKRSQVQQIFQRNARALAKERAQECRELLSCYVLASAATGAVPVPGVSQVSDLAILGRACQRFQWIFCLAEAQVAASDLAGIGAYLTLKIGISLPFILAVSQGAAAVADGVAWVPVLGIPFSVVVGAGVSAVGMWVALTTLADRMAEVAEIVYAFELSGQRYELAARRETLQGIIDDAFPEGSTGLVQPSDSLLAAFPPPPG